jgi:hypothetical protein
MRRAFPYFASQSQRRRALFVGVAVSILQLERGIDDRQTGNPHRLDRNLSIILYGSCHSSWSSSSRRVVPDQ